MTTNEGEVEILETEVETLEEVDEEEKDTTDWKAKYEETTARLKRAETKLEKSKTATKETASKSNGELGYGEKAFLVANGIKTADERALVEDYLSSGKTLDEIVENKHFLNDLKDLRSEKESKIAISGTSKRTGQSSRTEVEYWVAKGEMPPADQPDLRRAYVNAKLKSEQSSHFTANPLGGITIK